jgi:sigma-B regulation protein RsbU (phosphoserine phosphatase)
MSFAQPTDLASWEFVYLPASPDSALPQEPPPEIAGWRSMGEWSAADFTPDLEYWVRTRLPDDLVAPSSFIVSGRSPAFACFVADDLVQVHERSPDRGEGPPDEWYVVPLPADFRGRMLYLWRPFQMPELNIFEAIVVPTDGDGSGANAIATQVTLAQRSRLRGDLGYLGLGAVALFVGILAFALAARGARRRDAAILLFGAMSVVFGLRFLGRTGSIRSLSDWSDLEWQRVSAVLAYINSAVTWGFFRHYFGPGWKSFLSWFAWAFVVFGLVAVPLVFIHPDPQLLGPANNVLVIVGLLALVASVLRSESRHTVETRIWVAGGSAAALFVILENLRGLGMAGLLPFSIEWLGLLILYGTLGVLTARQLMSRERRLTSIDIELDTARRIQTGILPQHMPQITGLTVAARYVPMSEVAGDFYDFAEVQGGGLGVLVADVSGHGVPAALIASMVKVASAAESDHAHEPARVLTGMNRVLAGQLEDQFVTAGYAYVDPAGGKLRYSGAGHPPLMLLSADGGDITELTRNGLMLGPFPGVEYEHAVKELRSGDRILMYTDGIVEAANGSDEQFGAARLREVLIGSQALDAEGVADALLEKVSTWAGQAIDDDVTVVVIDVDR